MVENTIKYVDKNYANVRIDKYVIMPNHIHMIIILESPGGHGNPPLPNIVGQIKSYITKQLGYSIWQRSYYEHIIRNKYDYELIYKYIEENPIRWAYDKYYKEGK